MQRSVEILARIESREIIKVGGIFLRTKHTNFFDTKRNEIMEATIQKHQKITDVRVLEKIWFSSESAGRLEENHIALHRKKISSMIDCNWPSFTVI